MEKETKKKTMFEKIEENNRTIKNTKDIIEHSKGRKKNLTFHIMFSYMFLCLVTGFFIFDFINYAPGNLSSFFLLIPMGILIFVLLVEVKELLYHDKRYSENVKLLRLVYSTNRFIMANHLMEIQIELFKLIDDIDDILQEEKKNKVNDKVNDKVNKSTHKGRQKGSKNKPKDNEKVEENISIPKKKRGRPPKKMIATAEAIRNKTFKRGRGRPKKIKVIKEIKEVKRGRGRPKGSKNRR